MEDMETIQSISPEQITGLILAGGRGTRMGGQDKGLVAVNGRPLIEQVLEALRPQVGSVIISANRNIDRYQIYGYPVVADGMPGYPGPLAGILAGLDIAPTGWMLVVPCDSIRFPPDLARRLALEAVEGHALAVCSRDGDRTQPLHTLLATQLRQSLRDYLNAGHRRVLGWFEQMNAPSVDFADYQQPFPNLNSWP